MRAHGSGVWEDPGPGGGAVFLEYLTQDPAFYVVVLFTIVCSVTLHELGHVFAALQQGDETPRLLGRVTLDPLVHMGPSSLILAALAGIAFGATPVNPSRFKNLHGDAWVSFAGPLVNILLALTALTTLGIWMRVNGQTTVELGSPTRNNLHLFLFVFGQWNVVLAMFNLLPIPPLDGSSVVASYVPSYRRIAHLPEAQPWGFALVLIVALVTPIFRWGAEIAFAFVRLFT
jgi:Zn-dependent protease